MKTITAALILSLAAAQERYEVARDTPPVRKTTKVGNNIHMFAGVVKRCGGGGMRLAVGCDYVVSQEQAVDCAQIANSVRRA